MTPPIIVELGSVELAARDCERWAQDQTLKDRLAEVRSVISQSRGLFPDNIKEFCGSLEALSYDLMSLFSMTALLLQNVNTVFDDVDASAADQIANAGS
jgi:uncharacterized protein YoxC